jgi:hypothetical protein
MKLGERVERFFRTLEHALVMRIRAPWKVKESPGLAASYALRRAGISVSIVTFELGTMRPTR